MTHLPDFPRPSGSGHARWRMAVAIGGAALLMAGCGGGGESAAPPPPASDCSLTAQKRWLGDYMGEWYFWRLLAPRPDPAPYTDVPSWFNALLYTGGQSGFPRDRWSASESTETFNRFYGDGATLGYGVAVAGLEVTGLPDAPLWVRAVEPGSPAALAGVRRGDQVLSLNGRPASELQLSGDFSVLTAQRSGETLGLRLLRDGQERQVSLTAAVFPLVPVSGTATFTGAGGRRIGYVAVKNMIDQANPALETAFSRFRSEGVQDLVLDLRYNGGGLVSVGRTLASYVAGLRGDGRTYTQLLYNDRRAALNNERWGFSSPASALGLSRVFILTGPRTCSAAEQVINGLRGVGVAVTTVGDATCGKPVGFLPAANCGTTYSVVNFESVNDRNEGRWFDGFDASCRVAEDFRVPQGDPRDPLLATARSLIDGASCSALAGSRAWPLAAGRDQVPRPASDERADMIPR